MDNIFVKLFNVPSVSVDGVKIAFPSRKVEALFYYLAVNKEAGREEVAALLWPEAEAETGRKNLRNAIYYIKKSFNLEVVVSPKKSTIMLNSDIKLEIDIDLLNSSDKWQDAYTGEFLQGFTVKEEASLEEWITSCRDKYKSLYGQKLYAKLKQDFEVNDYAAAEQTARRLTEIDQYDEKAYRAMIKAYAGMELYNKSVDCYNRLSELLRKDLGIVPDAKSRMLFNKILELRSRSEIKEEAKRSKFFFGRKPELDRLQQQYGSFMAGEHYSSVIVIGEAGIGKTGLKDKFLEGIKEKGTAIIEVNCYQVEEEFPLKPWNTVFEGMQGLIEQKGEQVSGVSVGEFLQLSQVFASYSNSSGGFKLELLEDKVMNLLRKFSRKERLILVLEDIQWMDSLSLILLTSVMLRLPQGVFAIITCRNGFSQKVNNFISEMVKYEKLYKIQLKRFSRHETASFLREALPVGKLSEGLCENIYKETEGNTFFLVEYLNSIRENKASDVMSSKMADIIKSRFIGISEAGLKLINIIAMFYDEAPFEILLEISGMDETELVDVLDDLKIRYIIKESKDRNRLSLAFTHQKLRDFIYNQLSEARKHVIHGRIGKSIEAGLAGDESDASLYAKLIYHFKNGGNLMAALRYSIHNASYYLDFYHELFPVLGKGFDWSTAVPVLGNEDALRYLGDIEELLLRVKETVPLSDELVMLEIAFYHLKGRYLIRQGDYGNGVVLIKQMMEAAMERGFVDYVLKGHRQIIYYGIQTRRPDIMGEHIDKGLELARVMDYGADTGMFLRLKGLYCIMTREYDKAEELLKQCISIFQSRKYYSEKYAMHVAGAYSYIGDIRRYGMKFQSSLDYYDKAIELCESKKVLTSLTVFCTHAGQAAFDAGDFISAKAYFNRALKIYGQADSVWGRGIAEGYMALLHIREGAYAEALLSLKRADKYAAMIKNPYEIGLTYRIKAEIRSVMDTNRSLERIFAGYLSEDTIHYCKKGYELLKDVNDRYQLDIIDVFAEGKLKEK